MPTVNVTLRFTGRYIAHPYWPEMEKLINIQKESGFNRTRSAERRAKTLEAYLESKGMTTEQYKLLETQAARPFYTWRDVWVDGATRVKRDETEIVVPAHHLYGCLAQAADIAPSAVRPVRTDQIRTILTVSDFSTGKLKADGVFERFVTVKSGTGQTLSNQRSFRSNPYIEAFDASGTLRCANPETLPKVREFVAWAGREVGVGASRKLGYGRFTIAKWE